MATYYVDPTAPCNGTGSFGLPFNTWTSAWTAAGAGSSDVLLQKQGTTFTGTVGCSKNGANADAPIVVGVYNAITGERVVGVRGAAKINGNGGSIGISLQNCYNILIDGFEIYNCQNYGIYEGHPTGTLDQKADYVTAIQFRNLYVHHIFAYDLAAIWIQGSGVKYNNILIEDCAGDGICHAGSAIGEDITIRRINDTAGGLGDCISHQYCRSNSVWRRCSLDHSNNTQKQPMVLGTGVLITASDIVVEDCEFIGSAEGAGLVSVNFVTGVTIRRNKFTGNKGAYVLGATSVADIDSNIIIGQGGNTIGIGCTLGATVNARHNTIIGHQRGIELTGTNNMAKNNIVYSTGPSPIIAYTKANNYTNVEGDPALNLFYRPQTPAVKGAGVYLGGKDYYGSEFSNPPNIGAVDELSFATK
jgi:hypothetical protein